MNDLQSPSAKSPTRGRKKAALFLGEDGLFHTKIHLTCQRIKIRLPEDVVLDRRCKGCGSLAEFMEEAGMLAETDAQ